VLGGEVQKNKEKNLIKATPPLDIRGGKREKNNSISLRGKKDSRNQKKKGEPLGNERIADEEGAPF